MSSEGKDIRSSSHPENGVIGEEGAELYAELQVDVYSEYCASSSNGSDAKVSEVSAGCISRLVSWFSCWMSIVNSLHLYGSDRPPQLEGFGQATAAENVSNWDKEDS